MRTEVKLRVVDEKGVYQSSFCLEFKSEKMLDIFINGVLQCALESGAVLTPELANYDIEINGTKIEKSK